RHVFVPIVSPPFEAQCTLSAVLMRGPMLVFITGTNEGRRVGEQLGINELAGVYTPMHLHVEVDLEGRSWFEPPRNDLEPRRRCLETRDLGLLGQEALWVSDSPHDYANPAGLFGLTGWFGNVSPAEAIGALSRDFATLFVTACNSKPESETSNSMGAT